MIFATTGFVFQILWMTWQLCNASPNSKSHQKCTITKNNKVVCSHKQFNKVPDLQTFAKATFLDLSNNIIPSLHSKSFAATPKLTNLTISHNDLKIIDDQSFVGLKNLNVLDLSYNQIKSLSDHVFGKDLANLHRLHLEYNSLTRISQNMFDHLTGLTTLHLEHNKLTSIHRHSFNRLNVIEWITIDHNYLNNVSSDWFRPISRTVQHVALSHNPWICDARVCAYKQWLGTFPKDKIAQSNMLDISCCHGHDTTLKHIAAEILCKAPDHVDHHIMVFKNSHATLNCEDDKSTTWTKLTTRKNGTSACHLKVTESTGKLKISEGKIQITGIHKNDTGRYCCSAQDPKHSTCFTMKLSTRQTSNGQSGTTAVIIIVVIIVVLGGIYCFCKRKRRNYGVLRDERIPPEYKDEGFTETSNFSQSPSTTVGKSEVDEAYV